MNGIRKGLLGCSVAILLLVLGIAAVTGLSWSSIQTAVERGSAGEELALGRELGRRFGDQPTVEFECRLPVVDVAPCALAAGGRGTREVRLTFSRAEPPTGVPAAELARRIALAAHETSTFAAESDRIEIVFEEGDESASVVRKFTFSIQELAGDETPP